MIWFPKIAIISIDVLLLGSSTHTFEATNVIGEKDITADPETTTPNNCTCTTICRCGLDPSECDSGNPISWYPESSTSLGEVRDWCNTGD